MASQPGKIDLSWIDIDDELTKSQEDVIATFRTWQAIKTCTPQEMMANIIMTDRKGVDKLSNDDEFMVDYFAATHTEEPFKSCRKQGYSSVGLFLPQLLLAISSTCSGTHYTNLSVGQIAFIIEVMCKHDASGVIRDGIVDIEKSDFYITIDLEYFDNWFVERSGMPEEVRTIREGFASQAFESGYKNQLLMEYRRSFPNKISALMMCGVTPGQIPAKLEDEDTVEVFNFINATFVANMQRDVLRTGSYKDSKQILKELQAEMTKGAAGLGGAFAAAKKDMDTGIGKKEKRPVEKDARVEQDQDWRADAAELEEDLFPSPEEEPLPEEEMATDGILQEETGL